MKQYIKVLVEFDCDGNLLPKAIYWENNKKYDIEKVTDIRYAASLKAGGAGIRYTCKILGKNRFLFLENNRWFVETNYTYENNHIA